MHTCINTYIYTYFGTLYNILCQCHCHHLSNIEIMILPCFFTTWKPGGDPLSQHIRMRSDQILCSWNSQNSLV